MTECRIDCEIAVNFEFQKVEKKGKSVLKMFKNHQKKNAANVFFSKMENCSIDQSM
jgi:hypothetical protein